MASPISWRASRTRRSETRQPGFRPFLEALEDRLAPATFTVTNIGDSGAGSLRQAILSANASAGADTIAFNISGTGVHVIEPASPLPTITGAVAIKGATQPGFTSSPLIELYGAQAGIGSQGLLITASNCTIDALDIIRFGQYGIDIQGGTGNVVTRSYIGAPTTGSAIGNGNIAGGVDIWQGAKHNTIGGTSLSTGNVIAGSSGDGVVIFGNASNFNTIRNNYIGTLPDGAASDNILSGVDILGRASSNTVTGNILSNNSNGVTILDAGTTGNTVASNLIGLTASGSAQGNGFVGVEIALGATGNTIGGATIASENVISGNATAGVLISGAGTTGNTVNHNLIGVGADGTSNRGNGTYGIAVQDGAAGDTITNNTIGFNSAGGCCSTAAGRFR
jgi:Right handed beta helix region